MFSQCEKATINGDGKTGVWWEHLSLVLALLSKFSLNIAELLYRFSW